MSVSFCGNKPASTFETEIGFWPTGITVVGSRGSNVDAGGNAFGNMTLRRA